MKDKDLEKLIAVLLTSAVGGALIGLLMSSSREQTKLEKLEQTGDKYRKDVENTIAEIRRFVDKKSESAKSDAEATREDFAELGDDAKQKGRDLLERAKKLLSTDY